ncbi:HNH endonuclease [Azotobacter vinelandii]
MKRVGGKWYASDGGMGNQLAEEIDTPENYIEGASKMVSVNTYERSADARAKCVARYGYSCSVCGFDFEAVYGEIGQKYIHVHHIVPLAEIAKEYVLDPVKDLIPVCANCHAIIHRTRPALTIEQLKAHLAKK